jgi:hypothetical protein
MLKRIRATIILAMAIVVIALLIAPSVAWAEPTLTPDISWKLGVPAQSSVEFAVGGGGHLYYRISTPDQVVLDKRDHSNTPIERRVLPGKRGDYMDLFEIGPRGPVMARFDKQRGLVSGNTLLNPPDRSKPFQPIVVGGQIGYYQNAMSCFRPGQTITIPDTVGLHVGGVRIPVKSRLHQFAYLSPNRVVAAYTNLESTQVEIHVINIKNREVEIVPVNDKWINEGLQRKLDDVQNQTLKDVDPSIVQEYRRHRRLETRGIWNLTTHRGKVYFTPGREPQGQAHVYELDPGSGELVIHTLELPEPGGWHPQDFGVTDQYFFTLGTQGRVLRFRR